MKDDMPQSPQADSETKPSIETVTKSDRAQRGQEDAEAKRAIRKLERSSQKTMLEMMAVTGEMGSGGHLLHKKMNEAHISQMLDLAVQHDTNEYDLRKRQQSIDARDDSRNHWIRLLYFVIFVILLVLILFLFRNQPTVLVPILSGVGGIVAGFLGGMGFAKVQKNNTE